MVLVLVVAALRGLCVMVVRCMMSVKGRQPSVEIKARQTRFGPQCCSSFSSLALLCRADVVLVRVA